MYLLRIKDIPRKRLAGIAVECIRLLTEHGTEDHFGLDMDLDNIPELYEHPTPELEAENESRP